MLQVQYAMCFLVCTCHLLSPPLVSQSRAATFSGMAIVTALLCINFLYQPIFLTQTKYLRQASFMKKSFSQPSVWRGGIFKPRHQLCQGPLPLQPTTTHHTPLWLRRLQRHVWNDKTTLPRRKPESVGPIMPFQVFSTQPKDPHQALLRVPEYPYHIENEAFCRQTFAYSNTSKAWLTPT